MKLKIDKKKKFMFSSFEEYADIMGITPSHPSWEAFKIVWSMARTPALKVK